MFLCCDNRSVDMKADFTRDHDYVEMSASKAKAAVEKTVTDAGSRVSEAASDLAGRAKEGLSDLAGSAAEVSEQVKKTVGALTSDAAHSFKDAVEAHKTSGADAIASVARSARDAVEGLEKQSPQVARMVRTAADNVERVSSDLRDQSIDDLMRSVTSFAQRQPKLFFGCGVVAGLVLSRLLRSSAEA
jgi:hypothetical protein